MPKIYTNEELIFELQRFHRENGRVPKAADMLVKNGYPSYNVYTDRFGSHNNALEIARLTPNQVRHRLDGTETCYFCGKKADEIIGFKQWVYNKKTNKKYCNRCKIPEKRSDYIKGNLDKESSTSKGFISQRVIANFLNLELKDDCNCTKGFNYGVDLYDSEKYKYIDSKSSKLLDSSCVDSYWFFTLNKKRIPNAYIMLGWDKNRKNILKGWIIDSDNDLVYNKNSVVIKNNNENLKNWFNYEINDILLNEILHKMSQKRKDTNGDNCVFNNNDLINN